MSAYDSVMLCEFLSVYLYLHFTCEYTFLFVWYAWYFSYYNRKD